MNQIAKPRKTIFELLDDKRTQQALGAVAGRYMTADRLTRLVIFALKKTPKLAQCDAQSVLGAVMTTAALELEPNTPRGLAYLIPYDKRGKDPATGKWGVIGTECQFQIGYKGWIELTNRNPHLIKLSASAIHAGDFFDHQEGSDSFLRFKKSLTDRGSLTGSFCYAKYAKEHGEGEMAYVMPLDEIEKIRSKSETYVALLRGVDSADSDYKKASAQKKFDETPWVMWEDDMAGKSAIKKLCKVLPIGGNLTAAAMVDDAAASGQIDMTAMTDPDTVRAVVNGDDEPPMIDHQPGQEMPVMQHQERQAAPATKRQPDAPPQQPAHDPETGEIHDDAGQGAGDNLFSE